MTPERMLVLRDIGLGLSGVWILFPFSIDSPLVLSVGNVGLTALVTAVVVWIRYRAEHRSFPEWVADARDHLRAHPEQAVALTAVGIAVGVLPLVTVPTIIDEFYAGIAGLYLGYLGYRFGYGVIRPVPDGAMERFRTE